LKKQASVALSTTKAEYYTLGLPVKRPFWVKQLCKELLMSFSEPINIYTYNTGAVTV